MLSVTGTLEKVKKNPAVLRAGYKVDYGKELTNHSH